MKIKGNNEPRNSNPIDKKMKLIKKLSREKKGKYWQYFGLFLCPYCKKIVKRHLGSDKTNQSCGCMQNELVRKAKIKHGDAFKNNNKRLYRIWLHIKSRCNDSNLKCYKNYGGKGIKVCKQ